MKSFLATICILVMVGMIIGVVVSADTEKQVTCTVTPVEVSISLSRYTTAYGSMVLNTSKSDPSGAITVTAGTADVDVDFTGANATYNESGKCGDGVCTWTLATSPAQDTYKHTVTIESTETALTTSPQELISNLTGGTGKNFTLKIYTPTSGGTETEYGVSYSTTVTLTASYAY